MQKTKSAVTNHYWVIPALWLPMNYLPLLSSLFLYPVKLQSSVFLFHVAELFEYLLQVRPSGSELPQLLLIWECLNCWLLKDRFSGFLVGSSFLLALWIYWPSAFWSAKFLMRNMLIILLGNPLYMTICFSLTFKILSLALAFESLIL